MMVAGIDLFAHHPVLLEREAGLPHICVIDLASQWHRMSFPEAVYSVYPGENRECDTTLYRFDYQSFITPNSVFDYDLQVRSSTLLKRRKFPAMTVRNISERRYAVASDGARRFRFLWFIAMISARRLPSHAAHRLRELTVHLPGEFQLNVLSLLDRGVVFAIAHIRGGGDFGKKWHDPGRMMKKKNTFTDFIAAAEQLVAEQYTSRDRLIASGASAGGLLHGRRREHAARSIQGRGRQRAVRRRDQHDARRIAAADGRRVRGMGQSEEEVRIRLHAEYSPYDNSEAEAYPAMLVKTSPSTTAR